MAAPVPDDLLERAALAQGHLRVAGVDEAGRGPLAGPVVAAAVVLDLARVPAGVTDSKAIPAARRAALRDLILVSAEVGVGLATVAEIDALNILRASHLAMCRALAALPRPADLALIDGPMLPRELRGAGRPVIGGDGRSLSIAAASIIAKCARDAMMVDLAQHHPGYGWETNKGYATSLHRDALIRLGVTPHHRRSFAPVHNILYQAELLSD